MIKSGMMKLEGHVAILIGKPEEKRPLERRRRRREDNIKMNLETDRVLERGLGSSG
jgi:hypothetical protein